MPNREVSIVPISRAHGSELSALFERMRCPCYCRFWHFDGDKNAWLGRCAAEPETNRNEMLRALENRSSEMLGVVATAADGRVVGWLKVAPAATFHKLYDQRIYRGLPCFDASAGARSDVYTVGCLLVDPEWRRRSLSRKLLSGAIELCKQLGAVAIEAFPRRSDSASAEEMWLGPPNIFFEAGFEEVHAFQPYPVLRKTLVAN
jgi:GNAT superfamily N-acetyltransferase